MSRTAPMLVIAHRGLPRQYPDNSLAGVEAAIAHRADVVEIDAQWGACAPFLSHDEEAWRPGLATLADAFDVVAGRAMLQVDLKGTFDDQRQTARWVMRNMPMRDVWTFTTQAADVLAELSADGAPTGLITYDWDLEAAWCRKIPWALVPPVEKYVRPVPHGIMLDIGYVNSMSVLNLAWRIGAEAITTDVVDQVTG